MVQEEHENARSTASAQLKNNTKMTRKKTCKQKPASWVSDEVSNAQIDSNSNGSANDQLHSDTQQQQLSQHQQQQQQREKMMDSSVSSPRTTTCGYSCATAGAWCKEEAGELDGADLERNQMATNAIHEIQPPNQPPQPPPGQQHAATQQSARHVDAAPGPPPPPSAVAAAAVGGGVIFTAPSVWISPEWVQHPVIENFYGTAPRARLNSFCEVLFSPTSDMRTMTLGEACCSYEDTADAGDASRSAQNPTPLHPHVVLQHQHHHPRDTPAFSFDGSDSTERLSGISNDRSLTDYEDKVPTLDHLDQLAHCNAQRNGKHAPTKEQMQAETNSAGTSKWNNNRLRLGTLDAKEIVPVPVSSSTFHAKDHHHRELLLIQTDVLHDHSSSESSASPTSSTGTNSSSVPPSPFQDSPNSEMLRHKLLKTLIEIDDRILVEKRLAQDVSRQIKRHPVKEHSSRSVVWNLLCGANTAEISQYDGLTFIYERLSLVVRNRATNQLLRHRRHVHGILQIVTCHNPDLQLTEKQLDSFESATAMLNNDIKYSLLKKQVEWLETSLAKRREAHQHASCTNGSNCFDVTPVKISMMQKLLEAVSWYRLVQTNSRDDCSASASFGLEDTPGSLRQNTASDGESSDYPRKSLQELQVEKILNVLAGEEFYSDFSELMCLSDWWQTAQAHFENLIFSRSDSRLCQLMYRISKDVVAMSEENMEETSGGAREYGSPPARSPSSPKSFNVYSGPSPFLAANRARSEWMRNPQPEHILEFVEKLTRRVRKEFDIKSDVSKSLSVFIQRTVFPRIAVLCFDQRAVRDCQRKDKLWRKKCVELSSISMENLSIPSELAAKIRSSLQSRRLDRRGRQRVYLIHAIDAFNAMSSVVPCDLLEEMMHAVLVLHQEAALVLGTTQFSVETFFPLLAYVLLHCQLPLIHAQLHLLEKFAITSVNANGEESYYVYCVHAAVEFICNFSPPLETSADSAPAASSTTTTTTPSSGPDPPTDATTSPPVPAASATSAIIDVSPSTSTVPDATHLKNKTLPMASMDMTREPFSSSSACSSMSASSALSSSESIRPALSIVNT